MSSLKVLEWTLDGVLDEMQQVHKSMKDRQFAFILGAGASFTSGIPTGAQLAQRWLKELHVRECADGAPLDTWLGHCGVGEGRLTWDTVPEYYSQIFDRRFEGDRESGYAELEAAMEGKSPSLGYSLLAEIIQHTRHKVVVTTNFDNLVADALAMHAHQSPLVVAHESLTGFVRPQLRRPLVAKIHRDLYLNPINDAAGVANLEASWKLALKKLLQYFTPVVIGYAGNDGSLMDTLLELSPGDISGRTIWCYREGSTLPSKAQQMLMKHGGVAVRIPGFDEFMLELADRLVDGFDVAAIAERIQDLGKSRAERYREQAKNLQFASAKGTPAEQRAGEVLNRSIRLDNNWWAWEMKARAEPDITKRNDIYRRAIEQLPDSAEMIGSYATFLGEELQDRVAARALFERALKLDPNNTTTLGNFAVFLSRGRENEDAESAYKAALSVDPNHAVNLTNFATLLKIMGKDDDAAIMFTKAILVEPSNARTIGSYAEFLYRNKKNFDEAELLFEQAMALDPIHPINLEKYAQFIAIHLHDIDKAESMYRKSLELEPNNVNTAANFAYLLLTRRGIDSSEKIFELAQRIIDRAKPTPVQALAEALYYGAIVNELRPSANLRMLERLKGTINSGFLRGEWDFTTLFTTVIPQLPTERRELFRKIGDAILDESKLPDLRQLIAWTDIKAIEPFAII